MRKWNHLRGNTVAVGRTLDHLQAGGGRQRPASGVRRRRSGPGRSPARRKKGKSAKSGSKSAATKETATYHKVKTGETLSGIAESYNTTVANLKKNNANLSANLRAGEVLVIRK